MDKIFHFTLYCIVGFYVTSFTHNAFLSMTIMTILGAVDEFIIQRIVKTKTSDWRDYIVDLIGALTGIGAYICLIK